MTHWLEIFDHWDVRRTAESLVAAHGARAVEVADELADCAMRQDDHEQADRWRRVAAAARECERSSCAGAGWSLPLPRRAG